MKRAKKTIIIILGIILFLIIFIPIWAFFIEPNLLIIRRISINDPELKGTKIAFLSDLHVCQDGKAEVLRVINKVNAQNPDLILLGGDYLNILIYKNKSMDPKNISLLLTGLKAKYGIYMVFGNHDGSKRTTKIFQDTLKNTDIKILNNANTQIQIRDKTFYLVGIGDFSENRHKIDRAFNGVKTPVIVFTHSPDIFPLIPNYVNMVFAGHTHGGQVYIPFYGPLAQPTHCSGLYIKGFYEDGNKKMFVSSGVGTSHLKVRFFNLPEIVIADFK